MDKNYDFFTMNMALLYQIHGEKILVIKQRSIVGVYDDLKKAKKASKCIRNAEILRIKI